MKTTNKNVIPTKFDKGEAQFHMPTDSIETNISIEEQMKTGRFYFECGKYFKRFIDCFF